MGIFKKDTSAPASDQNAAGAPVADADRTAQLVATVVGQVLRAPAVDQELIDRERARYRRPKDSTRAFRVHVRGGITRFRRAGVVFTDEPVTVNAEDLTEAQAVELLNTPHLYVEELSSTSRDAVKPDDPTTATGADPSQLREPGDAPVPTPTNSPGRLGTGATLAGMTAVEQPATATRDNTAAAAPRTAARTTDKGETK